MGCECDEKKEGISVRKEKTQRIFNVGYYNIPFFQRAYVWEENLWEQFLDDIKEVSEKNEEHFMGFILFKLKDDNRDGFFDIIDGQQRLTTLFLFARALCEINSQAFDKKEFYNDDDKIILNHNLIDKPIFEEILEKGCLDDEKKKTHKENKILQCYYYFLEQKKKDLKKIDFSIILEKLFFVSMCLKEKDNVQKIFNRMNSAGTELTDGDLLKNEFFISDSDLKKGAIETYKETWMKTFEEDQNTRDYWEKEFITGKSNKQTNLDILLRSFADIKNFKAKPKDTLFMRYRNFLNQNENEKENIIYELMSYAKKYRENINLGYLDEQLNSQQTTRRANIIIFRLSITIIPYVLYILEKVEDETERNNIFKVLETYLMRRLIVNAKNKNYNNYFLALVHKEIDSAEKLKSIFYKKEKDKDTDTIMPDDSLLESEFNTRVLTNPLAKLVIYLLEIHASPRQAGHAFLAYNDYSLEHIMPKKWTKHWDDEQPLVALAREKRDQLILTFGNLTLLNPGYNSELNDLGWEEKKKGKEATTRKMARPGLLECCAAQTTFLPYLTREDGDWNENTIIERGNRLLELAKELWPYEEPEEPEEPEELEDPDGKDTSESSYTNN